MHGWSRPPEAGRCAGVFDVEAASEYSVVNYWERCSTVGWKVKLTYPAYCSALKEQQKKQLFSVAAVVLSKNLKSLSKILSAFKNQIDFVFANFASAGEKFSFF